MPRRMRPVLAGTLVLAGALAVVPASAAAEGGLAVAVGSPQGAFSDAVGTSGGLVGHVLLVQRGPLALRLDGSALLYDSHTLRVPVARTSGRIVDEITTDHWATQLTVGPELIAPGRGLRPYASALAGVAYMSTSSQIVRPGGRTSGASTNDEDAAFAYGATAGLLVPVGAGGTSVDLGVRYGRTSEVRFLTASDLQDTPDGLRLTPHHGHANILEFRLGLSFR